ncbi:poly(3-hydroxyalkanoate) depolymerase [Rhodococcus daqingensis]|uniref:Poly(3-hydroxyalkanoate) depolymerase n=1 Tax=Rhodococcus daqingensis TaxID=2479363 RepID=A0ABW2S0E1_9NOCA
MNRPVCPPDQTRIATVVGRRIRVSVRRGRGVPLVLCNGIGASLEMLQPLVDHLDDRTVIRFDVPGTGGSPTPALPYGFPCLAWLLGGLLDELGYGRVDVLGYSWGGALAQQFAFQNPRRCRRLVLAATATGALMVPARPSVLAKMLTPRRFTDTEYLASIAGKIYGGTAEDSAAAITQLIDHHRGGSGRGYLYQLLAGTTWTSLPALPAIRQPTLIIAGTDDPLIPVINARIMHRLLPNATVEIHDGGHVDLLTNAAEFGPAIERFLSATDPLPRSPARGR